MFTRHSMAVVAALLVAGCTGDEENPLSDPTEPVIEFEIPPPDVVTDWPCPPFEGVATTKDKVDDDDSDTLTDCQEEQLGSDPGNPDTDGDGVGDFYEVGDLLRPSDTDVDGTSDILDTDDDGDGVPTLEEDLDGDGNPRNDDVDLDGAVNYLDNDDDNDRVSGANEDAAEVVDSDGSTLFGAGNGNGDPRDDDYDSDGIANWLDPDDDADGASGCEDPDANGNAATDDTDSDLTPDFLDTDDDGDGIPTLDEDWDGSGTPCDDDNDGDTYKDFQDVDDDNDSILSLDEDLDGNGDPRNDDTDSDGIADFRDSDDDGDGVLTINEELEFIPGTGDTALPFDGDTDGDGLPNYLDADDDGDGCDTALEFDKTGALDADKDGISDYLEADQAACPPDTGTPPTPTGDTGAPPTPTGDTGTPTPTSWSLTIEGSGYLGLNGNMAHAAVVRDSDSSQVGTGSDTISLALFSIVVPSVLEVGETYTVDYFVDLDASGSCDPKTETSWRLTGISTTGMDELVLAPEASNQDPAACATFP